MSHEEKHSSNGIDSYIKMSKMRSIFFSEDFTKQSAAELTAMLLYYDHESHEEPIVLHLNSNGGDLSALHNIIDVMSMIKAPVKTICLGKCYSAGAVILAAGAKGERYILKNAKVMLHGVQFGYPIPGWDTAENKKYYEFVKNNNDSLMKILSQHTGQTLSKVKNDCARELWLSAQEAVKYNLVDHII
jgi:ATP-dependent Clp protease protease subunit